jgi:hypothetical protein
MFAREQENILVGLIDLSYRYSVSKRHTPSVYLLLFSVAPSIIIYN